MLRKMSHKVAKCALMISYTTDTDVLVSVHSFWNNDMYQVVPYVFCYLRATQQKKCLASVHLVLSPLAC